MEKALRDELRKATQSIRGLLEKEFSEQLEGTFDILADGTVMTVPGPHLSAAQRVVREKLIAVIAHKQTNDLAPEKAVAAYLREAAFTALNRFVALKMLEARGLVQECITRGDESSGFKEFTALAPGLVQLPDKGYRLYIETLFDEIGQEVQVLFDRRDVASLLWPRRSALLLLLEQLNSSELKPVWAGDETIGWVYQYFNSQEERESAKRARRVPETGREISLRSQYFTPDHIVRLLLDNTLGRIWYEMRSGRTRITEQCIHMLQANGTESYSRPPKDPRDLRVLDPACGSGHFLLYAFELFVAIYLEAWDEGDGPASEISGLSLRTDYPSREDLCSALPGLILRHNLYGVDLDSRCVQIAGLALWMRAQRAFRDLNVAPADRQAIAKCNIVAAAPVAGQSEETVSFVGGLDRTVASLFQSILSEMELAGEAGTLLRIERTIQKSIRALVGEHGDLFRQSDEEAWHAAEEKLLGAVRAYSDAVGTGERVRRRLFSEDASHGFEFIDICRRRYDAVVLNPPYTEVGGPFGTYLRKAYPDNWTNLYSAFIERALELSSGRVGVVCADGLLTGYRMRNLRQDFIERQKLVLLAPLDRQTFDEMGLATVAFVLDRAGNIQEPMLGDVSPRGFQVTDVITPAAVSAKVDFVLTPELIRHGHQSWEDARQFGTDYALVTKGNTTFDDSRFIRAWWEVPASNIGDIWQPWQKGGEYQPFFSSTPYVIRWEKSLDGHQLRSFGIQRVNTDAQVAQSSRYWWRAGLVGPTMNTTGAGFNARILPKGQIISAKSTGIFPMEEDDTYFLLGLLNSRSVRWMLYQQGAGLSGNTGKIKNIPVAAFTDEEKAHISELSREATLAMWQLETARETSPYFLSPAQALKSAAQSYKESISEIDAAVALRYTSSEIDEQVVPGVDLADKAISEATGGLTFKSPDWHVASYALGLAFGRWQPNVSKDLDLITVSDPMPSIPLGSGSADSNRTHADAAILIDDDGHPKHVERAVTSAFTDIYADASSTMMDQFLNGLGAGEGLRDWIRYRFFDLHRTEYSAGSRKAPIYWQLATPSASYSVWLYYHGLTRDTFFQVTRLVKEKLDHEAGKLNELQQSAGANPTSGQRKLLEMKEGLLEELRALFEEVQRVAPLWNPNLDDGVVINHAPLWRLVSHNRAWQKECQSAWEKLIAEEFDWSHLAMHLWPERVVPKCRKDHSLAIAHGLEDVFWVEGDKGKWRPLPVPASTLDALIAERSSAAVKSALEALLSAPEPRSAGRSTSTTRRPSNFRTRATASPRADAGVVLSAAIELDDATLDSVRQAISSASSGVSKSEVLTETGLSDSDWNKAINTLLASGDVTRSGEKRGTRYHASTREEAENE